jgi:hypothetical protein
MTHTDVNLAEKHPATARGDATRVDQQVDGGWQCHAADGSGYRQRRLVCGRQFPSDELALDFKSH